MPVRVFIGPFVIDRVSLLATNMQMKEWILTQIVRNDFNNEKRKLSGSHKVLLNEAREKVSTIKKIIGYELNLKFDFWTDTLQQPATWLAERHSRSNRTGAAARLETSSYITENNSSMNERLV